MNAVSCSRELSKLIALHNVLGAQYWQGVLEGDMGEGQQPVHDLHAYPRHGGQGPGFLQVAQLLMTVQCYKGR